MRVRYLLFFAFSLIAVIPVAGLGVWGYTQALQREIDEVQERHLLLAENLSSALERYAQDLVASFDLITSVSLSDKLSPAYADYLSKLDFVHFCVFNTNDRSLFREVVPGDFPCPQAIPKPRFDLFSQFAPDENVAFSPVLPNPSGDPTIYILSQRKGYLIVGAVTTRYIVEEGKAIAFGELGHAAIVDHTGQVLAHPNPSWERERKDIARVKPVQRMMARETGTTTFFSPAMLADMVVGYTFVPTAGWGVMVPQPFRELEKSAGSVQNWTVTIGLIGVALAAFISWIISGLLTRPVQEVVDAAGQIADGDLTTSVDLSRGFRPSELNELANRFNTMSERLNEANQSMQRAVDLANAATEAKANFLMSVTHELRTPLNGIMGLSELLEETNTNDEQREMIEQISQSTHAMMGVIGNVLDMSKIEAGRVDVELVPSELETLVDQCVTPFKRAADEKGLSLTKEVDGDLPFMIMTDPGRLRQILVNLIGNAIRFTDTGGIKFRVHETVSEDGSPQVSFSIVDSGIGIPEDKISALFQPFSQVQTKITDRRGGTGLGLSISKRFASLLGARLEVESVLGEGSTFRLHHPLHRMDAGAQTASANASDQAGAARKIAKTSSDDQIRILVAEDHPTNQWLIERQLQQLGYDADVFPNGKQALEAFKREDYDVLITDYLMPEMDGASLCEAVRRLKGVKASTIPIIGLTANAFEDALEHLKQAGATMVITKPASKSNLDDAIQTVLSTPTPSEDQLAFEPEAESLVVFDAEFCMDMFEDRPREGSAWLQDFLELTEMTMRSIRANLEANDLKALARDLHTLTGSAASAGAHELSATARFWYMSGDKREDENQNRVCHTNLEASFEKTRTAIREFASDLSAKA